MYQEVTLDCHPENKEMDIMDWHYLMPEKEVLLIGIIKRENEFKKPEIKIIDIQKIEDNRVSLL